MEHCIQEVFKDNKYLYNRADLCFYRYVWSLFDKNYQLSSDKFERIITAYALVYFYQEVISVKEDTTLDVEIDFIIANLSEFDIPDDIDEDGEYDYIEGLYKNFDIASLLAKHFDEHNLFYYMMVPLLFTDDDSIFYIVDKVEVEEGVEEDTTQSVVQEADDKKDDNYDDFFGDGDDDDEDYDEDEDYDDDEDYDYYGENENKIFTYDEYIIYNDDIASEIFYDEDLEEAYSYLRDNF